MTGRGNRRIELLPATCYNCAWTPDLEQDSGQSPFRYSPRGASCQGDRNRVLTNEQQIQVAEVAQNGVPAPRQPTRRPLPLLALWWRRANAPSALRSSVPRFQIFAHSGPFPGRDSNHQPGTSPSPAPVVRLAAGGSPDARSAQAFGELPGWIHWPAPICGASCVGASVWSPERSVRPQVGGSKSRTTATLRKS